jgi:hypothetical protein
MFTDSRHLQMACARIVRGRSTGVRAPKHPRTQNSPGDEICSSLAMWLFGLDKVPPELTLAVRSRPRDSGDLAVSSNLCTCWPQL